MISDLEQTANSINAAVSKKADSEGGVSSSFGYKLKSTGFELYSNNKTVMKVKQIEKMEELAQKVKELVSSNASTLDSQTDYINNYDRLCTMHSIEETRYKFLLKEKNGRLAKAKSMELFIESIKDKPDVIDCWNSDLWILLVDKAIVHHDKSITFVFKNMKEITIAAK